MAFKAFDHQYNNNNVYHEFCDYLNKKPSGINDLTDIPFLPIEFFKKHQITTGEYDASIVFESSGTTGVQTSKHFVNDIDFYHKNCINIFTKTYGAIDNHALFFLLPSYLERSNSSLVSMTQHLLDNNKNPYSGFYLNEYQGLEKQIVNCIKAKQPIILLGVTFGLLDFVDHLTQPIKYDQLVVMETGGMKGRRQEMTREKVHQTLLTKLKVPKIHSEYGMTELLSQVYSTGNGVFYKNEKIKTFIRELQDPLNVTETGKGGLNVIDLANIDSICFIATQDQGQIMEDSSFTITGRIDHSDIRGCNLMTV